MTRPHPADIVIAADLDARAAQAAFQQAADHATAHMHLSPQVDEDNAQAAYLDQWRRDHPNERAWKLPRLTARTIAALCLLGIGLGALLAALAFYRESNDGVWMFVAVVGAAILYFLYRATAGRKVTQ